MVSPLAPPEVFTCSFYNVLAHIVSGALLIKSYSRERVNCKAVSIPDRLFWHRFGFSCIKIKNLVTAGKKWSPRKPLSMHNSRKALPCKSEFGWGGQIVSSKIRLWSDDQEFPSSGWNAGKSFCGCLCAGVSSSMHKAFFHNLSKNFMYIISFRQIQTGSLFFFHICSEDELLSPWICFSFSTVLSAMLIKLSFCSPSRFFA